MACNSLVTKSGIHSLLHSLWSAVGILIVCKPTVFIQEIAEFWVESSLLKWRASRFITKSWHMKLSLKHRIPCPSVAFLMKGMFKGLMFIQIFSAFCLVAVQCTDWDLCVVYVNMCFCPRLLLSATVLVFLSQQTSYLLLFYFHWNISNCSSDIDMLSIFTAVQYTQIIVRLPLYHLTY
jgi:hypothetical protein